jgi:hypothetical protein
MTTRPHLHLVEVFKTSDDILVAPPPRARRIEIRITARDCRESVGRSRVFRLHEFDLDDLLRVAERMESRR